MPSIHNTTKRPLAVPLPGGKKLRLGPLQSGQVTGRALEHPPLKKLMESGVIELTDGGQPRGDSTTGTSGPTSGRSNPGAGCIRYTGDR